MLSATDYTAGYQKGQYLFRRVSFNLEQNDILGIVGTNGCGKSTFIKGLLNMVPFKTGIIQLDGSDITRLDTSSIMSKYSIGYLGQRNRIFGNLTIDEHIKLFKLYSKTSGIDNSLVDLLNKPFIGRGNMPAANLSGGEQLILGLLGLTIQNSDIILMDEPSDSLDEGHRYMLIDILRKWKDKALIVVEQDMNILAALTSNILKLNYHEK